MNQRNCLQLLQAQWEQGKFVCVGLDSDYDKIPDHIVNSHMEAAPAIFDFNKRIIDATKDIVCAYKPNSAFYEAIDDGFCVLSRTIHYIHQVAPEVPVIWDAKRADIGNTNKGYVTALQNLQADAITISPYLGQTAVQPFLDLKDTGIIVLCRTSNPGADEFQNIITDNGQPLYMRVADNVANIWNTNNNCMLVVGATCPEELAQVRKVVRETPILIPGIGAQGGDLQLTLQAGLTGVDGNVIINSSRGIIFASTDEDFATKAREEALTLNYNITTIQEKLDWC